AILFLVPIFGSLFAVVGFVAYGIRTEETGVRNVPAVAPATRGQPAASSQVAQVDAAPKSGARSRHSGETVPKPPEDAPNRPPADARSVTAKEIETFGGELLGQRCAMDGTFVEVDNGWVELLLQDRRYVGVFMEDSRGKLFQYAFADKSK